MIEHPYPTPATVKRLFAVSGNQCAFEKCEQSLVDLTSGKVTGRICHIKARRKNGPRFDTTQTSDDNRDFKNLILMCPIHHDVIDSDIKSYPVHRLEDIKKEHESKFENYRKEIKDEQADKFIQNIKIETIKIGSIFSISNVERSQVANQIINNESGEHKLYLIERKISSLRYLQGIYSYILPERINPDMDWDDALNGIAIRFKGIKHRIDEFQMEFSGFIGKEIEERLNQCKYICTDGSFKFDSEDELNSEGYIYANDLYDLFLATIDLYKEEIREFIKDTSR